MNIHEGKTYSLQGHDSSSEAYYRSIRALTDDLLRATSLPELLSVVSNAGKNRRRLRQLLAAEANDSSESKLVHTMNERFSMYTANTAAHLKSLSLTRRWDRTLASTEEQYHMYMIEIELVNRQNLAQFKACDTRLAFLPHCLHDLSVSCQSTIRGEDYACKGCSLICNINAVSKLLRRHGVSPYIWKTAKLEPLFKRLRHDGKSVGVLGIACIPELVNGMHLCARARVPVVGIPLDANKCARWWGEFYSNTVNVPELEKLLGDETMLSPGISRKASIAIKNTTTDTQR